MRLYVMCLTCNAKIYINSSAQFRNELPYSFTLRCQNPICQQFNHEAFFNRNEVYAEQDYLGVIGPTLILGALGGLVGGAPGALIGGIIGVATGSNADDSDKIKVQRFNNS